jgi:hypothetical protein
VIISFRLGEEIPPMKILTAICLVGLLASALAACGTPAPPDPVYERWHGEAYRGGANGGGGGGM